MPQDFFTFQPTSGRPKYYQVRDLGAGAHGSVKLVKNLQNGEYRAVKLIPRGEKVSKYAQQELLHLRRLAAHENIIGLREVFLTEDHLCIVLEYAPGGTLFDFVCRRGCRSEDDARWFFWQIVKAVDYCHRQGICNRDIKLENVLLMDDSARPSLKLCDFSFSKSYLHDAAESRVGTTMYMAPEVITARAGVKYDAQAADVWSCGVLLYTLLFGVYPFARMGDERFGCQVEHLVGARIRLGDYEIPTTFRSTGLFGHKTEQRVSVEFRELLLRMLTHKPEERITISEIMRHRWFRPGRFPFSLQRPMQRSLASLQPRPRLPGEEELRAVLREASYCPKEEEADRLVSLDLINEAESDDENAPGFVSSLVYAGGAH